MGKHGSNYANGNSANESWVCPVCETVNPYSAEKCEGCGEPAPRRKTQDKKGSSGALTAVLAAVCVVLIILNAIQLFAPGVSDISTSSNTNLLDNWYFASPVNQRNQESYSGARYTIDRWRMNDSGALSVVSGKGITLSSGSLYQLVNVPSLLGHTVTFSVATISDSGSITSTFLTAVLPNATGESLAAGRKECGEYTLELAVTSGNYVKCAVYCASGAAPTLYAAKLEFGSNSTLLNDGVLTEIPDYSTQLLKCQSYYLPVQSGVRFPVTSGKTTSTLSAFIFTPVKMASPPTVLDGQEITVYVDTGAYSKVACTVEGTDVKSTGILINLTTAAVASNAKYAGAIAEFPDGAALSCDLY